MGADEKHAATHHVGEYTPTTERVRQEYRNGRQFGELYSKKDFRAEFDRWLETVRAEAKWDALMETATVLERLDDDVEMYDENMRATPVTVWLRARANQYKENQ